MIIKIKCAIIKTGDFKFDNILIDEKSYENILVYSISYKHFIVKHLRIRAYDQTRYLVLFGSEKYDSIYNRIRYLISVKSGITSIISHNYVKIKVDSYDSLPLEKTMLFHDVIILIKSVFNKDKNNYYYNICSAKTSYELSKK